MQQAGSNGSLDLGVPSTPANSFITDICMLFVREWGNWLAAATWVSLLRTLGIPEPSARTALHRMTKTGYMERCAQDGRAGYAMSAAWIDWMPRADDELAAELEADDGKWTLLTLRIPEKRRADRHAMRVMLGRYGCASLGNGVWIASAKRLPVVRDAIRASGFTQYADIFEADYQGFVEASELAARCWDLDALADRYRSFIEDARRRLRHTSAAGSDAFVDVVMTNNEWRRIRFADPELPRSALPANWPHDRARDLRDDLLDRFVEPARSYVAAH
jgi:phenylacetic acid degradation operon negative regulatory protein